MKDGRAVTECVTIDGAIRRLEQQGEAAEDEARWWDPMVLNGFHRVLRKAKGGTITEWHKAMKELLPADAHLFCRVGDFYETFGDSARSVAGILETAVTKRTGTPMTGFPVHALHTSLKRLEDAKVKAILVERKGAGMKVNYVINPPGP